MLAEDDADEVVGAELVVSLLHVRRDLVVGLGDDVSHVDAGWIVTESAKGIQACHCFIVRRSAARGGEGVPPLPPGFVKSLESRVAKIGVCKVFHSETL